MSEWQIRLLKDAIEVIYDILRLENGNGHLSMAAAKQFQVLEDIISRGKPTE